MFSAFELDFRITHDGDFGQIQLGKQKRFYLRGTLGLSSMNKDMQPCSDFYGILSIGRKRWSSFVTTLQVFTLKNGRY